MTSNTVTPEWIVENATALAEHLANGGTMGQLRNLDRKHLEAVYTLGHSNYEAGRYKEAQQAFTFCLQNDHLEGRYYAALASCYQMLGKPAEAIKYYTTASILDIKDPYLTFHTAECLLALGMVEDAKEALDIVIRQSTDDTSRAPLLERAKAMRALLDQPAATVKGE